MISWHCHLPHTAIAKFGGNIIPCVLMGSFFNRLGNSSRRSRSVWHFEIHRIANRRRIILNRHFCCRKCRQVQWPQRRTLSIDQKNADRTENPTNLRKSISSNELLLSIRTEFMCANWPRYDCSPDESVIRGTDLVTSMVNLGTSTRFVIEEFVFEFRK
jgi:hypothetical protein